MKSLIKWMDRDNYPVSTTWDKGAPTLFENLMSNFDYLFGDASYINDDGNVVYEVELPGFNKDNIEVTLNNNILTVKGKRETKSGSHAGYKDFYKRLSVDKAENVDAKIEDGILYVTLLRIKSEEKKIELT